MDLMVKYLVITLVVAALMATTVLVSAETFGGGKVTYTNDDPQHGKQESQNSNRTARKRTQKPSRQSQRSDQQTREGSAPTSVDNTESGLHQTNTTSRVPPQTTADTAGKSRAVSATSTLTDQFRNYVSTLAQESQTNEDISLDSSTQEAAVEQFFKEHDIKEMVTSYTKFQQSDLSLVTDADQTQIKKYADRLSRILYPEGERRKLSAYPIYLKAKKAQAQQKRDKHIRRLEQAAQHYASIRDNLLTMNVPESAAQNHLALINSMSVLTARVKEMVHLTDNPVRAIIHAAAYKTQTQALVGAYRKTVRYFEQRNLEFPQT